MGEPAAGGLGQGGCVGAAAQHVDLDSGGVREKGLWTDLEGQVHWLGIWRTVWTVAFSRLELGRAGPLKLGPRTVTHQAFELGD